LKGPITLNDNFDSQNRIIPDAQVSNLAIWSIVLGILSLTIFSFLTGIPAIVCGNKAMSTIKTNASRGRGLALTGIIMGYLSVFIAVILIILILTGNLKP